MLATPTTATTSPSALVVRVLGLNLFVAPRGVARLVNTWLPNYAPTQGANVTPTLAMPALVRRLGHLANGQDTDLCAALALPPLGDPRGPVPRVPTVVAFFCGRGGAMGGAWDLAATEATLAHHADTLGSLVFNMLALGLVPAATNGAPLLFENRDHEPASGLVHLRSLAWREVLFDEAYVDPPYLVIVALTQFMRALAGVYVARKEPSLVRAILDTIVDALAELALAYDDGEEEEEEEEEEVDAMDLEMPPVAAADGRVDQPRVAIYGPLARALADPAASLDTLVAQLTATERAWHESKAREYERRWNKLLKKHHVRLDGVLDGDVGDHATV